MRPLLAKRADVDGNAMVGAVLCTDLRSSDGSIRFRKGRVLTAADGPALATLEWDELHLIVMDPEDVHEDEAGARIARASVGRGVHVGLPTAGHWPLHAQWRGIVEVSVDALDEVNSADGLCVYTLYDGHVVDTGEVVARAKITPFAMPRRIVSAAESLAQAANGLVSVRPFQPARFGAVVQEALAATALERFERALCEKVRWFGSELLEPCIAEPTARSVADAIDRQIARGATIVAVAGSKAMDPLDPVFQALHELEAGPERHGVPAHPGSLFWLARVGDVPILGLPTCGLFSQATVFDLVVPRILAGDRIDASTLARLGHGGLLTRDVAHRFPPYRPSRQRGALDIEEEER